MSSLRNFAIAFILALLALAGVAYYSMGVIASLFDPDEKVEVSGARREVIHYDTEIGGDVSKAIKTGRSFNILIVGTDYDPNVYSYAPDTTGKLVVPRRVKATTIYFARFDKEKRAFMLSLIPSSTVVTVDYVEMELGSAYAYKGAEFVRDQVAALTGVSIDFLFELSGRQFVSDGPKTSYTVPVSVDIPTYKGVAGGSFTEGESLSGDALYTYLHYDGYSVAQLPLREKLVDSIFLQAMNKFAATDDPVAYYKKIAPFTTNMTVDDASQLLEVLTTLPLFVGSDKDQTTVNVLEFYKCGVFTAGGRFMPDRAALNALFENCKIKNGK